MIQRGKVATESARQQTLLQLTMLIHCLYMHSIKARANDPGNLVPVTVPHPCSAIPLCAPLRVPLIRAQPAHTVQLLQPHDP
jgi:hypothetical protein